MARYVVSKILTVGFDDITHDTHTRHTHTDTAQKAKLKVCFFELNYMSISHPGLFHFNFHFHFNFQKKCHGLVNIQNKNKSNTIFNKFSMNSSNNLCSNIFVRRKKLFITFLGGTKVASYIWII